MEAAGAARAASSTVAERVERNAIARLEVGNPGADLDYFTARLVAHHEWEAADHPIGTEFPFIQMEIGTADSTGTDFDEELAVAGARRREFHQFCSKTILGLR